MKDTASNELLVAALGYAKRGRQVIPCRPRTKEPATRHGYKDGTTEKAKIVALWAAMPDANVAIVTGNPSGIAVLDEDPRNGGADSLVELEEVHGPLPKTLTAVTGGGGHHFVFALPEGLKLRTRKVADGLELLANGSYSMAPPSIHPNGNRYTWQTPLAALAPLPEWLCAAKGDEKTKSVDAADSKLGKAFAQLGLLGRSLDDGKRTVLCPWQEAHTTGRPQDGSTVIFPARHANGLGGFHCSHSHCNGRTASQALRELERRAMAGDAKAAWQVGLRRNGKGEPRSSFANIVLILQHDEAYAEKLRHDEMRGVVHFDGDEVVDATVSNIRVDLEQRYELQAGDADAARAVQLVAFQRGFHPVREFLNDLVWDGVSRLETVAREILDARAENDEEAKLQALLVKRWFVSLVARPLEPGCKVDTALILYGDQGVGKSSFFRVLGGEWFSDTEMALDKDAMMQLRGAWIYEWSELENVMGRQAIARIKAFLSSREDRYRPPFGRMTVNVKRSGVIVGTTNREDFLQDPSGSRRFWVVPVGKVNLRALTLVRVQLLAEAVSLWRAEERWWLSDEEETRRAVLVARFAEGDPWESDVLAFAEMQTHVRVTDVMERVLHIPIERREKKTEQRVTGILRRGGYEPIQVRLEGHKGRFWCRRNQ